MNEEQETRTASPSLKRKAASRPRLPTVEFHQHDWLPGFAAFLPGATQIKPQSRAFCMVNLNSILGTVEWDLIPRAELPYFLAESMMHEVIHTLEQWAEVEFSEERVEALLENYRLAALSPTLEAESEDLAPPCPSSHYSTPLAAHASRSRRRQVRSSSPSSRSRL